MRQLDVFVPVADSHAERMIDAGSGIVGTVIADPHGSGEDRVHVYFESNRHGYSNVVTFADRCEIAAGRMWEHYPTIAHAVLAVDELTRVGTFTEHHGVDVENVQHQMALTGWIGRRQPTITSLRHEELRLTRNRPAPVGSGWTARGSSWGRT